MKNRPAWFHRCRAVSASRGLALAVSLALCIGGESSASVAPSLPAPYFTVASATALGRGDAITGALPATQLIHVEVALTMRDRAGLDAFITSNASRQVRGLAPRLMTADEFLATHAPTQAQALAVARYLASTGFKNVTVAPNRLLMSADGTASTVSIAFATNLAQVRTRDGRIALANTDAVRIPLELGDKILSVVGLQTVHIAHPFAQRLDSTDAHSAGARPFAVMDHNPLDFSSIYSAGSTANAAGVTVGIATDGALTQVVTDLNTFTSNNSLGTVTTQTVNTGGTSTDISAVSAWDLDSQSLLGMAGGQVGKIIYYNIPSLTDSNLTADYNAAVVANQAKIMLVSFGGCEFQANADGSAAADDQIFATAVAQGQTFAVATGNAGADECGNGTNTPHWPASSQYVVAVAGTTLDATTTTWASETVFHLSGGSESKFEPKPAWQTLWNGTHRGAADVAFDADPASGADIINTGALATYGGTGLSAPIFAGMWARVIAVKGTGVGFAGPLIYALPVGDLHDITSGSNGIAAGVGYDLASGRGSIKLSSAITHIGGTGNSPPVAHFSFVANGLTENFTDSSTDPNGNATITARLWTFGDGSTSTATNPSHTYAAPGVYSASEKVTDNGGLTNTMTTSLTAASTIQLVVNPGFESGKATPWIIPAGVLNSNIAEPPHRGTWDVWLNGKGAANAVTVSQLVSIPTGRTSATLSFCLHVDTAETSTTQVKDHLIVRVTDAANNVLAVLATYSNLDHANGYVVHKFDLTPYLGQTVNLKFSGNENGSLQTSFVLDDIAVTLR